MHYLLLPPVTVPLIVCSCLTAIESIPASGGRARGRYGLSSRTPALQQLSLLLCPAVEQAIRYSLFPQLLPTPRYRSSCAPVRAQSSVGEPHYRRLIVLALSVRPPSLSPIPDFAVVDSLSGCTGLCLLLLVEMRALSGRR